MLKQKNILNTRKYIAYFKDIKHFLEIPSEFQANHFRLTATRGEGFGGWMKMVKGFRKKKRGKKTNHFNFEIKITLQLRRDCINLKSVVNVNVPSVFP